MIQFIKLIISFIILISIYGCNSTDDQSNRLERTHAIVNIGSSDQFLVGNLEGVHITSLSNFDLSNGITYSNSNSDLSANVVKSISINEAKTAVLLGTSDGLEVASLSEKISLNNFKTVDLTSVTEYDINNVTATSFLAEDSVLAGIYGRGLLLAQIDENGIVSNKILYNMNKSLKLILDIEVYNNIVMVSSKNNGFFIGKYSTENKNLSSLKKISLGTNSAVHDAKYDPASQLVGIATLRNLVFGKINSDGAFTKLRTYNVNTLDTTLKNIGFKQYRKIAFNSTATKVAVAESGGRYIVADIDNSTGVISNIKLYTVNETSKGISLDNIFSLQFYKDEYIIIGNETSTVTVQKI
ncbi:MAG: hypothetical protein GQ570_12000 [Helicobacteraceae bacterium]|nr:hypothetical protein [Helicobacteraceae bacterium]